MWSNIARLAWVELAVMRMFQRDLKHSWCRPHAPKRQGAGPGYDALHTDMRPADHPDFFRIAPPEGRSRESTIRLDAEGRFFHEGARVEHPRLEAAMHTWIARHPDDGRFILTN